MAILINIASAMICFAGSCYPALVGKTTPTGEFSFTRYTTSSFYGGDILAFHETHDSVYAVHRLIEVTNQNRFARIKSDDARDRIVTNGCVNVTNEVYQKLLDCCSNDVVTVER